METKKLLAEFIGTFTLTFIVILSSVQGSPLTPVFAGLTLGVFVYTIGSISGSHINPAVTIGLLSLKKIKTDEAVQFIIFQTLGAVSALILALLFGFNFPAITSVNEPFIFLTEMLGAALFTFGIAGVVIGGINNNLSGVIIGTSLFLGITIALLLGGMGFLNPAVALGNKTLTFATIMGPIVGAIIGMQTYNYLIKK